MAEHHGADVGTPVAMDYREHEKTYARFLGLVKYGTVFVVSILVFMMIAVLSSAGVIAGIVAFLAVNAIGYYALR